MKTPDYMSYERYKKKQSINPNKRLFIFVTTFFATLLVFTVIAKSLSPDVDVTIGDESQTDAKETGLGVKRFIDERLKMIQMEDNSAGVSIKKGEKEKSIQKEIIDDFAQEEEKITLPTKQDRDRGEDEYDEPIQLNRVPPRPAGKDLNTPFASAPTPKMTKVYVGRYSTIEQAKVAQEILVDSGLDITPFIKNTGGYYTLQIGSYSSRAKAEGVASELQRNSFPARVVQE